MDRQKRSHHLPWNNGTTIEKMVGCNWCCRITDFVQYIHAWNQGGIIIGVYDISLLQFLFWNKFERRRGCNFSFIIEKGSFIKWMTELKLEINSVPLKKGMTALLQRNKVPLKILDHCKWPPEIMTVTLKMYGCKWSFEKKIRLEYKYLSNTLHILNLWQQMIF